MGSPRQVRLLLMSIALVAVSTLPVFLVGSSFFGIGPELGIGPADVGAGAGPLILGVVLERWSFGSMWVLVSGCLLVAAWLAWSVMALRRVLARAV